MTFVAVLYANTDYPLIVVDSLVSRPANAAEGIPTPLLAKPDARLGLGYQAVGLGRKFWLLPDRSLFLYSGTVGSARKLFDYLSEHLTATQRYDRAMHQDAREFRNKRTDRKFSFLVVTPSETEIELYADGEVRQKEISTYGYVMAIGSGAEEGLDILHRYPGTWPNSLNDLMNNALNAAARLTQDYMDDWGIGSKMSAVSCGGYFEVVPPALYERSYEHLYRGTAQVFLTFDGGGDRLSRFIAANQGDENTVIVVGSDLAIPFESGGFSVSGACLRQYTIHADQKDSLKEIPFDGNVPFGHIASLVVYADAVPDCGLREHAFRTFSVSFMDGEAIALLQEDDSPVLVDPATNTKINTCLVQFTMTSLEMSPLDRMRTMIHNHMQCRHCANVASS